MKNRKKLLFGFFLPQNSIFSRLLALKRRFSKKGAHFRDQREKLSLKLYKYCHVALNYDKNAFFSLKLATF